MFNLDTLTLAEVAKIEELSGQSVSSLGDDDKPKGLAMAAMAFVTQRRTNPQYTWNEACGLTVAEANAVLGLGAAEEEAPADPPAARSRTRKPSDD